jgi:chemotaxis protein MotB
MRRLQARPGHSRVSRERWLVSHADFITLLFAFFATLYAISSVDAQKLKSVRTRYKSRSTIPRGRARSRRTAVERRGTVISDGAERSSADVEARVSQELAEELKSERLELIVDRRGVTRRFPKPARSASAATSCQIPHKRMVGRIANTLAPFSNAIRVEGHTDDVPIHNVRFASN